MSIDGSTIAAILTGILALVGAVASAWMSGWNLQRLESRKNQKALARSSGPLLIAPWDLANWLYDILKDTAYSPWRCESCAGAAHVVRQAIASFADPRF